MKTSQRDFSAAEKQAYGARNAKSPARERAASSPALKGVAVSSREHGHGVESTERAMERIRTFNARRGTLRSIDQENSGPQTISVAPGKTKKREEYEKKVKLDRRELEQKYIELQAKLEDTEAFWKDDSRHKDKRICELERSCKNMADSNSFLNIKLRMLEQELSDKCEEASQLRAQLERGEKQRQQALKFSSKFV